jgi:hypothetical protein
MNIEHHNQINQIQLPFKSLKRKTKTSEFGLIFSINQVCIVKINIRNIQFLAKV